MNPQVRKLADKAGALRSAMQEMTDQTEKEDRDFTPEEAEQFAAYKTECIALENRKTRIEELLAHAAKPENLKTGEGLILPDPDKPRIEGKGPVFVDDPKEGFKTHTEFLMAVMQAPETRAR